MKYMIDGKEYVYSSHVRDCEKIRQSFNKLSKITFDLSFEGWYQNHYWGEDYILHVLIDDERVVANVSVNIINTSWSNQKKRYIQLGTVMTDLEYRSRGLSRFLMEKVLSEWEDKCDAIYLFANDSVLDFYPKFGFTSVKEYQSSISVTKNAATVKKLNMSDEQDKCLLIDKYKEYSNPYSALPMINNVGLLMFYCSQFMKENIYYIKQYDAVVIAEYTGNTLLCYDIYCNGTACMTEIVSAMAVESKCDVKFGFPLKETIGFEIKPFYQEDTTLFVLDSKENLFSDNKLMFPLLSHA